MQGLELSPPSKRVDPRGVAMFSTRAPASGELRGILVGARRCSDDDWIPATELVTIEAVIVHGVHVPLWAGVIEAERMGWQLWSRVRGGNTVAVFVESRAPTELELRAVLVVGPQSLAR